MTLPRLRIRRNAFTYVSDFAPCSSQTPVEEDKPSEEQIDFLLNASNDSDADPTFCASETDETSSNDDSEIEIPKKRKKNQENDAQKSQMVEIAEPKNDRTDEVEYQPKQTEQTELDEKPELAEGPEQSNGNEENGKITHHLSKTIGEQIWKWCLGKKLLKREIKAYAKKLFEEAGITNFKASEGWYRRWMNRWQKKKNTDKNKTESEIAERLTSNQSEDNFIVDDDAAAEAFLSQLILPIDDDSDLYYDDERCNFKIPNLELEFGDDPLDLEHSCFSLLGDNEDLLKDCEETDGLILENKAEKSKRKSERYLPQFKKKVIKHALKTTIREAANHFNVNKETITNWIRNEPRDEQTNETVQKEIHPDEEFLKWIHSERMNDQFITQDTLKNKIDELIASNSIGENKSNAWFYRYAKRILGDNSCEKGHIPYPSSFKEEIAILSKQHSKKLIGKIFQIDRKRISEWIDYIEGVKEKTKRDTAHYLTDNKIDNDIWEWYKNQTSKPSTKQIREKAISMYHEAGFTGMTCSTGWYYRWRKRYTLPSFKSEKKSQDEELLVWVLGEFDKNITVTHSQLQTKAAALNESHTKPSASWAVRFSQRYAKILQEYPHPTINLPNILQSRVSDFQNFITSKVTEKSLSPKNIIAMDEIALNFNSSGIVKTKKHSFRKSSFENCNASIIICCSADGSLLPTTVITKSEIEDEIARINCFSLVQPNGVNDACIVKNWFDALQPHFETPSLILCDPYEPHLHLKDYCEDNLKGSDVEVNIIPAGCSPKLQPILFGIKDKFKTEIEQQWQKWQQQTGWASVGGVQLLSHVNVFAWVQVAHHRVSQNGKLFVQECFSKAGYISMEEQTDQV